MRLEILKALVEFSEPVQVIKQKLSALPWDAEDTLIVTRSAVSGVIKRYVSGEISESELILWADAIEVRDDLDYEHGYDEMLKKFFIETANPDLFGTIDSVKAKDWLSRFS